MMATTTVSLYHQKQYLSKLVEYVNHQNTILLITSTPSVANVILNIDKSLRVYQITGANNNLYPFVMEKIQKKEVDVLILGIEQLINPRKLNDVMNYYQSVNHVFIMNINQILPSNFDYQPEYETLPAVLRAFPQADVSLFSYTLDQTAIIQLTKYFGPINNQYRQLDINFNYYEFDMFIRIEPLLELLHEESTVVLVHDYDEATLLAHQINQFRPCGCIHRRMAEVIKVQNQIHWQNHLLDCVVITTDMILPFNHPLITQVIWATMPVDQQQLEYFSHYFNVDQTFLLFNKQEITHDDVMTHQFVMDDAINKLITLLHQHPEGLTMREIERYLDGNSYLLERTIKGLLVKQAIKRKGAGYVVDQPYQLSQAEIDTHHQQKQAAFQQLYNALVPSPHPFKITNQHDDYLKHLPLPVAPKVLFPTGFFKQSLIDPSLQSDNGYVFALAYDHLEHRIEAIDTLLKSLSINYDDVTITNFSLDDQVKHLAQTFSEHYKVEFKNVFAPFDSSILKRKHNPYHQLKAIMSQFELLIASPIKPICLVFANHGHHFWQMGVLAKVLLENQLTQRVIVIFNQP